MTRLAGLAAVALAIAWLPGQTAAGALRLWIAVGALPVLWAWRGRALPGAAWAWVCLAALALVAAISSPAPGAAVAVALTQLGWVVALGLGAWARPQAVAPWLSGAGAVAALPGLFLEGGTFGNPDYLAAFLVGTLPWTLAAMPAGRRLHGASAVVQLGALIGTQSLGGLVALAVAATAFGVRAGGRVRLLAVALGLVGVATATQSDAVREHLAGRRYLAEISLQIAQMQPLTGVGAGGFHRAFLPAQAQHLAEHPDQADRWSNPYHAHAEPLQAAVEQGVPGALLLLLPVLAALARPRPGPAWPTVIGYAVLGAVSLPLFMPGAAWLAAFAVGASLGRPSAPPHGAWRAVGLCLALPALGVASMDLLADRLLARADAAGDAHVAETAASLALRPAPALRVAADARLARDPGAALALALAADAVEPSVEGHMLRGRIFMVQADFARAQAAFQDALTLHPGLFAGWFALSRAREDAGDRAGARAAAARARALRPTDPRLRHLPE
ncbi:MAG: O-antigen ligase family protein [bacterium]